MLLWHETVVYHGERYRVINTYQDGTVDLDTGENVNIDEIEVIKDGDRQGLAGAIPAQG